MLFKRIEPTRRNALSCVGKVNCEVFMGKPADTVLCTSISDTKTAEGWLTKYSFQHNNSWNIKVVLDGSTTDERLYPSANFNTLELTVGDAV